MPLPAASPSPVPHPSLCGWRLAAPGRPHLCGPAVKAAHEDSRGAQQEELQDREAEQDQLQPLDVELEGEGKRESGQGLAGYLYPLGGLSRGQTQPAGGSGGLRCAHGGGGHHATQAG